MWDKIMTSIENSGVMVVSAVIVIFISFLLYRVSVRALNLLQKRDRLEAPVVSTLRLILRWVFVLLGSLLVLQTIGVLQNVWASLLAISAAVAIGFVAEWSLLTNVFSTLLVLIYRPFRIGDTVEIPTEQVKGQVVDINFFYSTFKVDDENFVQVPNKLFFFKPIVRQKGDVSISLYDQLKSNTPADE